MKTINNISIIGMGALGLLYGKLIADARGKDAVRYIVDEERFEKYKDMEVTVNGEVFDCQVIRAEDAKPADLVIVAVKYTGLEEALDVMEKAVGPDTIIISVLNGITSEHIIGARYGYENIIFTVALGMDAMRFGRSLTYTQKGKLVLGEEKESLTPVAAHNLRAVIRLFSSCGVPFVIASDIEYRIWSKLMLNVGVNQTCMIYNTTYKGVLEPGEANRTFIGAMREVIALANAEGIPLTEKDLNSNVDIIRTLSPEGTPSMGQDRINRVPSEVDAFAGTIIKLAEKHGLYVPVNQFIYERVKEIEAEY